MRFNDYLNKETSVRPVQQGITIRDEKREQQLEAQIENMSLQLSSNKADSQELVTLRRSLRDLTEEFQQEQQKRIRAEADAERSQHQLDIQRQFETEIIGLSKKAESFQSTVQEIQLELVEKERINRKQQEELLSLTATNGILENSKEDLIRQVKLAEHRLELANHAKDSVAEMLMKEQTKYDTVIADKESLDHDYNSTIKQRDYLTAVSARLDEELTMERERVKNLSASLGLVQTSYNTTKHHLNNSSVETKDLQEQVTSLLNSLTDSNNHNSYLIEKQEYLEAVLSKPRYTSEASIARNEGFKMPLGGMATNRGKNYLGTGKPTLLKFKKKESTNDNTE